MAQRRMFSPDIVDSDAFLDMPVSSQLLYFHLSMRADDDGFISPKKVMRLIGVGDDDLKVLLAKRFLLPFESGVVVVKHWLIHNLIRKDRYKETRYIEEKKLLKIKENGAYTEIGQPNGNQMAPQVRLGKVKIGNTSEAPDGAGNEINEIISLFKEVNPSIGKYYANKTQRAAVARMLKEHGKENLESMIKVLPQVNARPFWPKSTTPIELENNLGKYKALKESDTSKSNSKIKATIIT